MGPNHHPLPETMVSFASGTLADTIAAVVAGHVAMCQSCAQDLRRLEVLGGLLLERIQVNAGDHAGAARVLARVTAGGLMEKPVRDRMTGPDHSLLPQLLTRGLHLSDGVILWQALAAGVWQHRIQLPNASGRVWLLRLAPGQYFLPDQRQGSAGLALILQGSLTGDSDGEYVRGDIIEGDGANRELRATKTGECICLMAQESESAGTVSWSLGTLRRKALSHLAVREAWQRPAALAASLALVVGFGLGWLVRGGPNTDTVAALMTADGHRLVAQQALHDALDTLPSGKERTVSLNGETLLFEVKMTFRDQAGGYCRQYQIAADGSKRYEGVACRTGDRWAVSLQALLPGTPGAPRRIIPAGEGANAMDAVVASQIQGDPLVGADEAAIMGRGWTR